MKRSVLAHCALRVVVVHAEERAARSSDPSPQRATWVHSFAERGDALNMYSAGSGSPAGLGVAGGSRSRVGRVGIVDHSRHEVMIGTSLGIGIADSTTPRRAVCAH
jgi:hypothetical protein